MSDAAYLHLDDQEVGIIDLTAYRNALHSKWQPHVGQVPIGNALFYKGYKDIFACCGRNFGKTELIAYCADRWANENPGSENYIFGPIQKQIKEILWASGRIQGLGPEEYKKSTNNVEMRIVFNNGSFLKLDGSDNVDAYRGIKPKGLSVFDEFKDMRKNFIDAYDPNRAAYDSPAIFIGTPPEFHNHFVDYMERAKKYHGKSWFYHHAPSSMNPYLSRRFLEAKKLELYESGESETWLREYEAIFVKGSKRHIFPMFLKLEFKPFEIPIDIHKWTLVISFDPAASSTFGVLFALFNPYSKKVIVFDEIYESDPAKMVSRDIFLQVEEKIRKFRENYRPKNIRWIYDEAAKYFASEIYSIPKTYPNLGGDKIYINDWEMEPSRKAAAGTEGYISIMRMVLNKGLLTVTENCTFFRKEMDNYIKDEKGKLPDKDDHLINAGEYLLQAVGFSPEGDNEPKVEEYYPRRGYAMGSEDTKNKLVDFDSQFQHNSFEGYLDD